MRKILNVCLITVLFVASFQVSSEKLLDQTIVIVEQDVILESELNRRMKAVKVQLRDRNQPIPSNDLLQPQVLDRMIVDSLQLQMAGRAGVRVSEQELNSAVGDIANQNKQTLAQLQASLAKDGINYELFREDLREEIMIARIRRGQVSRRISVSEREIDNLVTMIDAEGSQRIEYHLGHILISISDSSDQAVIQAAREKANNLIVQLREGANFQNAAIAHSSSQEALQGGDFGWKTIAQLPTLFSGPAKSMREGEVSEPLRSGSGFHILKLLEKRGEQKHFVQQANARHILLMPNKLRDEKATELKIRDLYKQIKNGADFSELAKAHSEDKGSALQGGELGWTDPSSFVSPFKETVETISLKTLSDPIQTQYGWHIIEVLERRNADQTLEKKREQATRILQARKFDEEVEVWLRELKDNAYVERLFEL